MEFHDVMHKGCAIPFVRVVEGGVDEEHAVLHARGSPGCSMEAQVIVHVVEQSE